VDAFEMLEVIDDAEEQEWQDRALCAETDPEAFFPEEGWFHSGGEADLQRVRGAFPVFGVRAGPRRALRHLGGLSERNAAGLKRRAG